MNQKENILSSFLCVHACIVSGGCCLCVACEDTTLFVYVACMGGWSGSAGYFKWILSVVVILSATSTCSTELFFSR